MSGRFGGKTALVTGAASGIGAATAARLASEGARVLAVDLDGGGLDTLRSSCGAGVETEVVDVSQPAAAGRLADACRERFGRLDMLVNNAGVGGSRPLHETDDDQMARFIDVNLVSVMRLSRAALPILSRPGGAIVNVASVFGEVGYRGSAAYSVAKAGVAQLTRQMTADYAGEGIRINAVAPGVIRTNMTARRIDEDAEYGRAMIGTTPLARVGSPDEVAAAIAFLLSDDASFVAGVVLPVDGGWMATKIVGRPG